MKESEMSAQAVGRSIGASLIYEWMMMMILLFLPFAIVVVVVLILIGERLRRWWWWRRTNRTRICAGLNEHSGSGTHVRRRRETIPARHRTSVTTSAGDGSKPGMTTSFHHTGHDDGPIGRDMNVWKHGPELTVGIRQTGHIFGSHHDGRRRRDLRRRFPDPVGDGGEVSEVCLKTTHGAGRIIPS